MAIERHTVIVYLVRCDQCGAPAPHAYTSVLAADAAKQLEWTCKREWDEKGQLNGVDL